MSEDPSAERPIEETAANRLFSSTQQVTAPLKKRGRPRKKQETDYEHDIALIPIDGDYEKLALANKHPDWEYYWVSDYDLERFAGRPWVPEKWGPNCCRPKYSYGTHPEGEPIMMQKLHLMKMQRRYAELVQKRDPKRIRHEMNRKVLFEHARENGRFEQKTTDVNTADVSSTVSASYTER